MICTGLLLFHLTGVVRAQGDAKSAAASAAEQPSSIAIMADRPIENRGFWTSDLAKDFPGSNWPDDATVAFEGRFKGPWNWTEKRDFHGDGVPTALLVRGADSDVREDGFVVEDLILVKWGGKNWQELVRISRKDGITLNGDGPKRAPEPNGIGYSVVLRSARMRVVDPTIGAPVQLWIKAKAVDSKGTATGKRSEIGYSSEKKKYSFKGPSGLP